MTTPPAPEQLVRGCLWLYILLLPMVHWLSPSGWLPLTNIPLLVALVFLPLAPATRLRLGWRDIAVLLLAALAILSTAANIALVTQRSINHLSALLFVTLLNYFVGGRVALHFLQDRWKLPLLLGFVFSCLLCVFEFVLVNGFHHPLPGYRPSTEVYDSTFVFGVRPRSTFSESGHFAFYLACVAPVLVAAYREQNRPGIARLVIFLLLLCATLLFSTSLFLVLFIWLLMYVALNRVYTRWWGLLLIAVFSLLVVSAGSVLYDLADALVFEKFRLYSFEDRQEKFTTMVDLLTGSTPLQLLFGHGMGSFEALGVPNSISAYTNFALDLGLVGCLLFLLILMPPELFTDTRDIWKRTWLYLCAGLVFFFLAVPNYFFPHFTFVLALMSSASAGERVVRQSEGAEALPVVS
jgi:hypothetical protein